MINRKIIICGHFAGDSERFDGQTIKTRLVFEQLVKKYGEGNIKKIDTFNWKKRPFSIFAECVKAARMASNIIIMPSMNGVKIFVPLFIKLKKKNSFKLHYVVIGGWICDVIKQKRRLENSITQVDCVYIENHKTMGKLKEMGLNNLYYMTNFKELKKSRYKKDASSEFKCCIFSRIEKLKGILDAIDVINRYNNEHDKKVYLDIYGKIKDVFEDEFMKAIASNKYVEYLGVIDSDKSVEVIEKYDLLLFPTRYMTEGIPGTIIDSYFAGTPVLASKWENFDEMIVDGKTGFGYNFGDNEDFCDKLALIVKNRKQLLRISKNCLAEADNYLPENSIEVLYKNIERS